MIAQRFGSAVYLLRGTSHADVPLTEFEGDHRWLVRGISRAYFRAAIAPRQYNGRASI